MPDSRAFPLTVFLVKKGITDPDKILEKRHTLQNFSVKASSGDFLGVLYVRRSIVRQSSWVEFFADVLDVEEIEARSASSAAVLLIQRDGRVYAVTFGYGRNLLVDGVVEERFGLRATLNAIHSQKVRSIDKKTFEVVSRHTREQVSRESGFEAFGLDVEQDLLRAVTGRPADESLGIQLTGRDALVANVHITIDQLSLQLDRYRKLSARKKYQKQYPWVDHIAELSDKKLAEDLDMLLTAKLNSAETEGIWLAPPEIIDWSDFKGFKYRPAESAREFPELALEHYLEDCREPGDITPDKLRTDCVRYISSETDSEKYRWSVRRCLGAELKHRGELFVLSEGSWYRIDTKYANGVSSAIEALPHTVVQLPPFDDEDEAAYNKRVHEESDGNLALMDRVAIPVEGPRGTVEFCDLYSAHRILIHVKRYRGSSSMLSHLFAQGLVSGRLLFLDPRFRKSLNERLPPTHSLADPAAHVDAAGYEVAFAVIERPGKTLSLPFFSKVNLRNVCELLCGFGYRVTLTPIPAKNASGG